MIKNDKKIIYFGTSEFSAIILKFFLTQFKVEAVVTQPDRPSGRKQELAETPVKIIARKHNLKIIQPQNIKDEFFLDQLKEINADVGILAAYAELIPENIIDLFPKEILNIHPSLLPKYRGASPIQTAILNGDEKTGVTIIKLVEKLDAGPIVAQKEYPISKDDNNVTLHQKLADIGAELLIEILPNYLNEEVGIIEQDETQVTVTKELKKDNGRIDWNKNSDDIERQFRAFFPWPGVFTYYNQKRLKISDLELYMGNIDRKLQPGEVFLDRNNQLLVKCNQGFIVLKNIQIEGKKEITFEEFNKGYKPAGSILG